MFSSVGWGEIAVLVVVGLVVIGPERLPKLVHELRAILLAARNAVNDAKQQLGDDFGEDFEDLRKPLADLGTMRQMGARGFITKTLLDGDDSYLTSLGESVKGIGAGARSVADSARGTGGKGDDAPSAAPTPRPADPAAGEGGTGAGVEVQQQAEAGSGNAPGSGRAWTDFDDAT